MKNGNETKWRTTMKKEMEKSKDQLRQKPADYFRKAHSTRPSVEIVGYVKCQSCQRYVRPGKLVSYTRMPKKIAMRLKKPCPSCKQGPSWWFEITTVNLHNTIMIAPGDCLVLNYSVAVPNW